MTWIVYGIAGLLAVASVAVVLWALLGPEAAGNQAGQAKGMLILTGSAGLALAAAVAVVGALIRWLI